MKQLGAYGNDTKTNILINEFMKGRQNTLKAEEELIVNDVKDYINEGSFVEQFHHILNDQKLVIVLLIYFAMGLSHSVSPKQYNDADIVDGD